MPAGVLKAVDGVSFSVLRGETLAIVGESGSGKSVTSLSLLRLISSPGKIVGGRALFSGKDGHAVNLLEVSEAEMRRRRGNDLAMIFQEPMTALNPSFTVGDQIAEAIQLHQRLRRKEALRAAADLLDLVGIADPVNRLRNYPHQMSGGMRQRVVIAMAISSHPTLLIADEPTTALDVTVQAQILDLLKSLKQRTGMSILFITHNLGVVAEIADRVIVMYAGQVSESATVAQLRDSPKHPYTLGLLKSMPPEVSYASVTAPEPRPKAVPARLEAIPGSVPSLLYPPTACRFEPRCRFRIEACQSVVPELENLGADRLSRCLRAREL
jgi:oligopeptide/dipeptide ABC transporter ATP-binding protein